MSGQTISTSEMRVEALKLQSSAYGVTIPLVYGVTKISGNLVWYGGFKAIPHTTEQGGKGGGVKVQNTTFTYQASVMMGLCHGRISAIPRIWRGKKMYTGGLTPAQLLTATESYTPPGSGAMTYTVTHAANFAAMINITWTDSESWAHTLAKGYDYSVSSAGVVTVLRDEWRGRLVAVRYQYYSGAVSLSALDELGLTFLRGDIAQTMWSGFSSFPSIPNEHLGYSGIAAVAGLDYDLGTGAQVENHTFEVVGPMAYQISDLSGPLPDVDPAPMLHDVLTNTQGGASFNPDALDDWTAWSNFCVASGLMVSPAITEQQPAADVLRMAAELTVTGPVWSGGRLKMIPYADTAVSGRGRTFTPNTTPVYDLDDDSFLVSTPGEAPLRSRLKSPANRYNHVRVEYRNRQNQYNLDVAEATDAADIDERGRRTMPTVRAHWICDGTTARLVAQLLMQRSLYVCNEYEATLPWHYALLEPMDLVTLSDARLEMDDEPARILVIEEDEAGELRCEFEDYPAGQASAALYPNEVGAGFAHDYNVAPGNADAPVIFEAPVDRTLTGLALYVAVKGSGAAWGGAQVWVSQDGANYKQIGVVYGSARAGTLSANAGAGASTIAVQGLGSEQLLSGSAADATALNTLCYVGGSNPEYFAYQTATLTGAGAYTLSGLVHGAYGTSALAHTSGDVFVRVDERVAKSEDLDLSMIGKTIYVKLCSFNIYGGAQQGLADVSATTYTVTGVMAAIPPANVAGFTAQAIPGFIRLKWTQNNERDVPGGAIELRRFSSAVWGSGVRLEDGTAGSTNASGNSYDWAWPAPGSYTLMARHRDALGNLSTGTTSFAITVTATDIAINGSALSIAMGGGNLLPNSSFESDSDGNGVPDAWGGTDIGTGITLVRSLVSTAAHGQFGFRMNVTALTSPSSSTHVAFQELPRRTPVLAGHSYVLSCSGLTSTLQYKMRIGLRWLDSSAVPIGGDQTFAHTFAAADAFERMSSGAVVAPAGAVSVLALVGIQRPSVGDTTLGSMVFDAFLFQAGDYATQYAPMEDEILPGVVGTPEITDDAVSVTDNSVANDTGNAFTWTGSGTFTHSPVGFFNPSSAVEKLLLNVKASIDLVNMSGSIGSFSYAAIDVDLLWDGVVVPNAGYYAEGRRYVSGSDPAASVTVNLYWAGTGSDVAAISGVPATSAHTYGLRATVQLMDASGVPLTAAVSGNWDSNTFNRATKLKK